MMTRQVPNWVVIAGAVFGGLTLLFFMLLIVMSVFGLEVPCDSRFLVVVVIAFGVALSITFLGGAVAARGSVPLPFISRHPFTFSASGGIAAFIVVLTLSNSLFSKNCESPIVGCADGYQSHYVSQLRFGFCYPRRGWELDTAAIDIRAADIFIRASEDRNIGVRYHLTTVPAVFMNEQDDYFQRTAVTWSQLDENIEHGPTNVGGRKAYSYQLTPLNGKGEPMPTRITHIFLSNEMLLEIYASHMEDTSDVLKSEIESIVASTSIFK